MFIFCSQNSSQICFLLPMVFGQYCWNLIACLFSLDIPLVSNDYIFLQNEIVCIKHSLTRLFIVKRFCNIFIYFDFRIGVLLIASQIFFESKITLETVYFSIFFQFTSFLVKFFFITFSKNEGNTLVRFCCDLKYRCQS